MRNLVIPTMLALAVLSSTAMAADCESYTGTRVDTTKETAALMGKGLAAVKAHNVKGLFALSAGKVILLRRSVSDDQDRNGNIRLALRPRDLDGNMKIHIANQIFPDFSDGSLFDGLDPANAISVSREVCEGARHCDDDLPPSEEMPFVMKDLLQCNQGGKGIFVFSDGIFVTDMQLSPGKMPIGSALFFAKDHGTYHLAGLISQR